MERSLEREWRDIVARLEDMPAEDVSAEQAPRARIDNGFAHWALAVGLLSILPLATPETLPIALPFGATAMLLGLTGLFTSVGAGRGRRRSLVAMVLGGVPLVTASVVLSLTLA